MVFSSFQFLFVFLPVFFAVYWLIPNSRARNIIILVGSLFFYFWGEKQYVTVMLASIFLTWGCGRLIGEAADPAWRLRFLLLGVAANVGLLIYFKYFNFFLESIDALAGAAGFGQVAKNFAHVHLPIGVSFFTFQAISYLVDLYRNAVSCQRSLIVFGMYKSMFPQLIAGPIVRYSHIEKQVYDRPFDWDQVAAGMTRFVVGFSQKMLLANPCGAAADQVFGAPLSSFGPAAAWVGALAYTMQIFFDFCGYSNMAIGLGAMMGFRFPENFDYPYTARSVTDFWRRWHMSLSSWFRDYVYIPLGGNRGSQGRTLLNLLIVFALCGFWHGATWSFLVWGLFHGLLLVFERLGLGEWLKAWPAFFARLYTFVFVMIGWVIFRSDSVAYALGYMGKLGGFREARSGQEAAPVVPVLLHDLLTYETMIYMSCAIVVSLGFLRPVSGWLEKIVARDGPEGMAVELARSVMLISLFIVSLTYLAGTSFNPFIYFRF